MHVDIADQLGLDHALFALDARVDRGHVRGCCDLGVRQIEGERRVEQQRQLLLVQHRGDADAVGHFEHEADEGRLHRSLDAHRRPPARGVIGRLLPQRAFSGPRTLGEFAHHFDRQWRRSAGPGIRQQVHEQPLAGSHRVDGHPPCEREPDRRAIGIGARGGNIVRHGVADLADRHGHRPLEADHDDLARGGHLGLNVLGEFYREPGIAGIGLQDGFAPHRFTLSEGGCRGGGQRQAKDGRQRPAPAASGYLRRGAAERAELCRPSHHACHQRQRSGRRRIRRFRRLRL